MTNSARLAVEIEFADDVTRTVKPLTIRTLRKFMKIADKLDVGESGKLSDDDIDHMISAAAIVLEDVDPELAKDRDKLEASLDVETFWKIMQVAMGNKIADPNE